MSADNIVINQSTVVDSTTAANISLLKLGTFAQTLVGVFLTVSIISVTVLTITLISTGVGYSPPRAAPDFVQSYKGVTFNISPLGNDRDPKGAKLTITKVSKPWHGTVEINKDGTTLKYTSIRSMATDSFNYTVSNSKLSAVSYVVVDMLNLDPVAVPYELSVPKNSVNNVFKLLEMKNGADVGITDADGDELTIVEVTPAAHGEITLDNNVITYTPNHNSNEKDIITYTVFDGTARVNSTVTFTPVNFPPVANPNSYVIPKNTIAVFQPLEGDSDSNDDKINLVSVTQSKTVIEVNDDQQTVTYYASPQREPYSDSFEYTISDGDLETSSFVTVQVVNTPPVAIPRTERVNKNTANNTIEVKCSDVDIMDSYTITLASQPANGVAYLASKANSKVVSFAGTSYTVEGADFYVLYTPREGFAGVDSLQFKCSDGFDESVATLTITVVNRAPVPVADTAETQKNYDVEIRVVDNDKDPDNDQLILANFETITSAEQGVVTRVSNKVLRYSPRSKFTGQDTFTYTVEDVQESSASDLKLNATAKVTVTVKNTAPVAVDDSDSVPRGGKKVINVLANDHDINGQFKDTSGNDDIRVVSVTAPAGGYSTSIVAGGVEITAPISVFPGLVKFSYTIQDGSGAEASADVYVTVVNYDPVAVVDDAQVKWNQLDSSENQVLINIIDNDTDQNVGDSLKINEIVDSPSHGSVVVVNSLEVLYTPNTAFVGDDTFTYTTTDGFGGFSQKATVTVHVTNVAPIATDDTIAVDSGVETELDVLLNDYDLDGDAVFLVESSISNPSKGTVFVREVQLKKVIVYTTNGPQSGQDSFTYAITDNEKTSTATVTLAISNAAPNAVDDALTIHWVKSSITVNVLDNDSDEDGDELTIVSVVPAALPQMASFNPQYITVSEDKKTVIYNPTGRVARVQTFTYTITDGVNQASANIVITETNNDIPQARIIDRTVHWSTQTTGTTISILTNNLDSEGDEIKYTITQQPTNGAVVQSGASVVYTQNTDYVGSDTFIVTVTDGLDTAAVTVNIVVYNTAPQANHFTIVKFMSEISSGFSVDGILEASADDDDAQDSVEIHSINPTGTVTGGNIQVDPISPKTSILFTPLSGWTGTVTTDVTFTDGLAQKTITYTLTVLVDADKSDLYYEPHTFDIHWRSTVNEFSLVDYLIDDVGPVSITSVDTSSNRGGVVEQLTGLNVRYTQPSTVVLGTDYFNLDFTDGFTTLTATFGVRVRNTKPVVHSITNSTHQSTPIVIDILERTDDLEATDADTADVPNLTLKVVQSSISPVSATVSVHNGKSFLVTPAQGALQTITFSYVVFDGLQESDAAQVTVTIQNNKPSASPITKEVHWRDAGSVSVNILTEGLVSDSDADVVSVYSVIKNSASGTLTWNSGSSSLTFACVSRVLTSYTLTYVVSDGAELVSSTITITVVNRVPTTNNIPLPDRHWRSSTFSVNTLTQGSATDGDSQDVPFLTVTSLSAGSVDNTVKTTINFNTAVTVADLGTKTVTYRISDTLQESASRSITWRYTNTRPTAQPFNVPLLWRQTADVVLGGACSDADTADSGLVAFARVENLQAFTQAEFDSKLNTNTVAQATLKGALTVLDSTAKSLRYTPSSSIVYTDGTTVRTTTATFVYYCTDGLQEGSGTVTFTVRNTVPTATNLNYNFPLVYGATEYAVTGIMSPNAVDADGDPLTLRLTNAVASGTTDATLIVGSNFDGATKTFTYRLCDAQLCSNEATVTVTFTNSAPVCSDMSITIFKGGSGSIPVSQCTDANGDPIQLILQSQVNIPFTKSISADSKTIYFTSSESESGVYEVLFKGQDSRGAQSNQAKVVVTVVNREPLAMDLTWSLSAHRRSSQIYTLDYLALSYAYDMDAYDNTRLALTIENAGTCGSHGVLSVVSRQVQFDKTIGFYTGSCTFTVRVTDADANLYNRKSVVHTVTVNVSAGPIYANGLTVTKEDMDSVFFMSTSDIMVNDVDPLGGALVFVEFQTEGLRPAAVPVLLADGRYQFTQKSNACQPDRIKYLIKSYEHPTYTATGYFTVQFTNCQCAVSMDIVFVFDGSSKLTESQFNDMKTYVTSVAGSFEVSSTAVNLGLVRYDTSGAAIVSALTSDKQAFVTTVAAMTYASGGSSTFLKHGLEKANTMLSAGRANAGKTVITLITREPTGPCGCTSCQSVGETCAFPSVYPWRQCNGCNGDYNRRLGCGPCADPRVIASTINSKSGWRNVVVAVGSGLGTTSGQLLISDIASASTTLFKSEWSNLLTSFLQPVVDVTCQLSSATKPGYRVVEPSEPTVLRCCDIVTLRQKNNYFYVSSSNVLKADTTSDFNALKQDRSNVFQVHCAGAEVYGKNLTVGDSFYLWSLHNKKFVTPGTSSSTVSSDTPTQAFTITADGSVSGKFYIGSSYCMRDSTGKLLAGNSALATTTTCSNVDAQIYVEPLSWSDVYGADSQIRMTDLICQDTEPLVCSGIVPIITGVLWPPNGQNLTVTFSNILDSLGRTVSANIKIFDIIQDEPTIADGAGDAGRCPDGRIMSETSSALIRSERAGTNSAGRRYYFIMRGFEVIQTQTLLTCDPDAVYGTGFYVPHSMGGSKTYPTFIDTSIDALFASATSATTSEQVMSDAQLKALGWYRSRKCDPICVNAGTCPRCDMFDSTRESGCKL